MITPLKIQERLFSLSNQIDHCHEDLVQAESEYHIGKANYEIAMAKSRIGLAEAKLTAQGREDTALVENQDAHMKLAHTEAKVKATRALANKLKTQVDITRSMSVSVNNEMSV